MVVHEVDQLRSRVDQQTINKVFVDIIKNSLVLGLIGLPDLIKLDTVYIKFDLSLNEQDQDRIGIDQAISRIDQSDLFLFVAAFVVQELQEVSKRKRLHISH